MAVGESLAEHSQEIWAVLGLFIVVILSLIGLIYRGLATRLTRLENKIPDLTIITNDFAKLKQLEKQIPADITTTGILTQHCRKMQKECPQNFQIDQIAKDTASIRESITKIMGKQEVLREQILPEQYVSQLDYERAITRLEKTISDNMSEFKQVMNEKIKDIKDMIRGKGVV